MPFNKYQVEDSTLSHIINNRRPYTQKSKQAIDKWRLKHKEKYLELNRKHNKDYYIRNKVGILAKQREAYHQRKSQESSQYIIYITIKPPREMSSKTFRKSVSKSVSKKCFKKLISHKSCSKVLVKSLLQSLCKCQTYI